MDVPLERGLPWRGEPSRSAEAGQSADPAASESPSRSERILQRIAAYCSFWGGFPCRLAARDAIDNE